MADGNSLINLGELSKPATLLVEKISNAIGVVYEPTRIKRKARAEAEADKIHALAKIELSEIQHRAIERFVKQETRKQENIEEITAQAVSTLPPTADVANLDEDWIAHFFRQCGTVSDRKMQSLWARLLSGEASAPGSFSKRTIDFVSSMDSKDALLFTTFCQFVWRIGDSTPLIYSLEDDLIATKGINFDSLMHLDSVGLISYESPNSYMKPTIGKYAYFSYFDRQLLLEFPLNENNQLRTGHVLLTSIGKELALICGAEKNELFYQSVIARWYNDGLVLTSPLTLQS